MSCAWLASTCGKGRLILEHTNMSSLWHGNLVLSMQLRSGLSFLAIADIDWPDWQDMANALWPVSLKV